MNKDISDKHTFVVCAYRESKYLEECIRSLLRQKYRSTILMSTGTPNEHIRKLAQKYGIRLFVNDQPSSIANDWNFAMECAKTELVTLAHQDDLYEPEYSKRVIEAYQKAKNPIILFTDYCELRGNKKIKTNRLLRVKRILLSPLKAPVFWKSRFIRRRILSFGSAICCPAVTMVKARMPVPLFEDNMKSNIDWQAWEMLSNKRGDFVYISKPLMQHRIHEGSTTSELLENKARREEDLVVFRKFWPEPIAKMIEKVYQQGEKSNSL